MKKVSIITINYNNAEGLKKTIESVISQKFNNYEFIVIDGNSSDSSVEIIKQNLDKIDYWVSEPDYGIYNAMNKGVQHAQGEYCIFMNSGDCFYNPLCINNVFSHGYDHDIITGKTVGQKKIDDRFIHGIDMSFLVLYRETIGHQSSFIKKDLLVKHPYDEFLKIVADWKFFIQSIILDNCTFIFCDEKVASIDLEGISVINSELRSKEREQVLYELFPPRILSDYEKIKKLDDSSLKMISIINETYTLKKIINFIVSLYLKFKK